MQLRKAYLESIALEDLPKDLRLLAEAIGLETVRDIMDKLEGHTFYIRSAQRLGPAARRFIRERYRREPDGTDNGRELASALRLSLKHVYNAANGR
jgi:Mor family transcriptional regulator